MHGLASTFKTCDPGTAGGSVSCIAAVALSVAALLCSCGKPLDPQLRGDFEFAVVDVGQGLSQIAICGPVAIVWDMGPPEGYADWKTHYDRSSSPSIGAIIISHTDLDHRGGLAQLDLHIEWTGLVVVSALEDTALIRANAGEWGSSLRFRCVGAGDTVGGLAGVRVECLWPPPNTELVGPVPEEHRNRYSLVFQIVHGENRILVTSDIDSIAEERLRAAHGGALRSDILVVPHHGSAGSYEPVFFGHVAPSVAVISCGANNSYGHPDPRLLMLLAGMGLDVKLTSLSGTVAFSSDGYRVNEDRN